MCVKAVYTYLSAIQIVPECYKTQKKKKSDKSVADDCLFLFDSVAGQHKTYGMSHKVYFKEYFMLKYCLDIYKTQEICDKAVNALLPKLVLAELSHLKCLKKLILYSLIMNHGLHFYDVDYDIVTFFGDGMGLITKDINNINLGDKSSAEEFIGVIDLNNVRHVKKDRQRINAYNMESNKRVELVYGKR